MEHSQLILMTTSPITQQLQCMCATALRGKKNIEEKTTAALPQRFGQYAKTKTDLLPNQLPILPPTSMG